MCIRDRLQVVGKNYNIPVFEMGDKLSPVEISKKALEYAAENRNDVILIDTAGRLHINEEPVSYTHLTVIATGLEDDIPAPEPRRVAQPVEKAPETTEEVVEESTEETAEQRPARRFADLDDFESEIKIPDFLTRKKF